MSDKALIITPTGCDMFYDDAYVRDDHWRYAKPGRSYEVCVVAFGGYEPKPGTYDYLIEADGRKFHLIRDLCKWFAWDDYDYIGTWDDDYATDIQSVETALSIARKFDFRMFQQAMISWNTYDCLKHDPYFLWTETNFIETGVPFFRNDIFRKFLRFLDDYEYKESEWGIDKILCDLIQGTAHVVHASTAKHMRQESWYDKTNAFKEMDYLTQEFFPKYMKEKFGREWVFRDRQDALSGLIKDRYEGNS